MNTKERRRNVKNNYRNLNEYKLALKFENDSLNNKIDIAIRLAEKAPEILSQIIGKPCKAVNYQSAYGNYTVTIREQNCDRILAQYIELLPGVRIVAETEDRLDLKLVYNTLKSGVIDSESRIPLQA